MKPGMVVASAYAWVLYGGVRQAGTATAGPTPDPLPRTWVATAGERSSAEGRQSSRPTRPSTSPLSVCRTAAVASSRPARGRSACSSSRGIAGLSLVGDGQDGGVVARCPVDGLLCPSSLRALLTGESSSGCHLDQWGFRSPRTLDLPAGSREQTRESDRRTSATWARIESLHRSSRGLHGLPRVSTRGSSGGRQWNDDCPGAPIQTRRARRA